MASHGPFTYSVEEPQVVRAMQRLMRGRLRSGPARWLIWLIAFLLIALMAMDVMLTGRLSGPAIAFLLAVPIALMLVHFWMAPMMARRQFRQSVALRAEQTIAWDDEAIEFRSERGQARLPFGEFHGFGDTAEMIMLYQTEMYFNLVPKGPLGDAADDLIARLEAAGVKRV